jgi:hypothetical protein
MKKNLMLLLALFVMAFFYTSCEEEEDQKVNDPYMRIEGKWNMEKYAQRGDPMIELEGSFWEFFYNDTTEAPYQGVDSLTSYYGSSGTFEYQIAETEDTLYVTDSNQAGGYFHGKWVITQFDENALELIREYDDEWGDTLRFSR